MLWLSASVILVELEVLRLILHLQHVCLCVFYLVKVVRDQRLTLVGVVCCAVDK